MTRWISSLVAGWALAWGFMASAEPPAAFCSERGTVIEEQCSLTPNESEWIEAENGCFYRETEAVCDAGRSIEDRRRDRPGRPGDGWDRPRRPGDGWDRPRRPGRPGPGRPGRPPGPPPGYPGHPPGYPPHPGYPPGPGYPAPRYEYIQIHCGDGGWYQQQCYTGGRVVRAQLRYQRSSTPCLPNRTWGVNYNSIWVSNGCSGVFDVQIERRGNW